MKDIDASEGQDIITHIDMRGNRYLLPELATKIARIKETDETCLTIKKDEIKIKKFS